VEPVRAIRARSRSIRARADRRPPTGARPG
jgi:hypothetical protein